MDPGSGLGRVTTKFDWLGRLRGKEERARYRRRGLRTFNQETTEVEIDLPFPAQARSDARANGTGARSWPGNPGALAPGQGHTDARGSAAAVARSFHRA